MAGKDKDLHSGQGASKSIKLSWTPCSDEVSQTKSYKRELCPSLSSRCPDRSQSYYHKLFPLLASIGPYFKRRRNILALLSEEESYNNPNRHFIGRPSFCLYCCRKVSIRFMLCSSFTLRAKTGSDIITMEVFSSNGFPGH